MQSSFQMKRLQDMPEPASDALRPPDGTPSSEGGSAHFEIEKGCRTSCAESEMSNPVHRKMPAAMIRRAPAQQKEMRATSSVYRISATQVKSAIPGIFEFI